jgi:hypothetical protein
MATIKKNFELPGIYFGNGHFHIFTYRTNNTGIFYWVNDDGTYDSGYARGHSRVDLKVSKPELPIINGDKYFYPVKKMYNTFIDDCKKEGFADIKDNEEGHQYAKAGANFLKNSKFITGEYHEKAIKFVQKADEARIAEEQRIEEENRLKTELLNKLDTIHDKTVTNDELKLLKQDIDKTKLADETYLKKFAKAQEKICISKFQELTDLEKLTVIFDDFIDEYSINDQEIKTQLKLEFQQQIKKFYDIYYIYLTITIIYSVILCCTIRVCFWKNKSKKKKELPEFKFYDIENPL